MDCPFCEQYTELELVEKAFYTLPVGKYYIRCPTCETEWSEEEYRGKRYLARKKLEEQENE